jgi:hypothetical protein
MVNVFHGEIGFNFVLHHTKYRGRSFSVRIVKINIEGVGHFGFCLGN